LLRHTFPQAGYRLFEDPDVIARFRADPQGFIDALDPPVILDEIQNVPELFAYVRTRIDAAPRRTGRWLLTGSQETGLMREVTESLAGRAAILQLLPLSRRETPRVTLLHGGYPEVVARPAAASLWFASYLQTYLERDVRAVSEIRDLALFRRFIGLLATRHGQLLNLTDLAAPLGVSVPTLSRWVDVLEVTGQVLLVPPWFENLGRRLIKSPRVYLVDSGLACHLLGIDTAAQLARSPFLGPILEGAIAAEIVKTQIATGARRALYFFRDQQGLEVDFVVPAPGGDVALVEVKATHTPTPDMARPMQRLAEAWRATDGPRGHVSMTLVHRAARGAPDTTSIGPGIRAVTFEAFIDQLDTLARR
jgi:predicted AAA+ superfamily ATPase